MKSTSLAIVVLCSSSALAQPYLSIRDEQKLPVPAASVTAMATDQSLAADNRGLVNLAAFENSSDSLQIHSIGFESGVVAWPSADTAYVQLVPRTVQLGELNVTALRGNGNTPFAQSVVNQEDIRKVNEGRDLPYLLETIPGLVTFSDAGAGVGYTGLRLRGSDVTRINVTLNGVPVNDAESQGVFWVNMPDLGSNLESVQLQRGVGGSTNGPGAFGGAISLQTQGAAEQPSSTFNVSGGSFGTLRTSVQVATGNKNGWWMRANGAYITSEGWVDRASSRMNSAGLSGGFSNSKTAVKAVWFGGSERTYQSWYGIDEATFQSNPSFNFAGALYDSTGTISGYYGGETDNYRQDHFQLHWNQRLNDRIRFSLSGFFTPGQGYYEQYRQGEDYSAYRLAMGPDAVGNSGDLIRRLWLNNQFYGTLFNFNALFASVELTWGGSVSRYLGDHYGTVEWAQQAFAAQPGDRFYFNSSTKDDANTYLKAVWQAADSWQVYTDLQVRGVRYSGTGLDEGDVVVNFSDEHLFFNPKLGITHSIDATADVWFSAAVAHREPNRVDLLGVQPGEESPRPEQLLDLELGYKIAREQFIVNATTYAMIYRDQLVQTGELNNVGAFIRSNVGESYRTGLEVNGTYSFSQKIDLGGWVALSRNINANYLVPDDEGNLTPRNTTIAYSPGFLGSLQIAWKPLSGVELSLAARHVGEQELTNDNVSGLVLEAYTVLDARASYSFQLKSGSSWRLFAAAFNLGNSVYAANGYVFDNARYLYPQAPLNFLAGLAITL